MKKIIYKQDNGAIAVITPSQWALDAYGIEAIAQKDVPASKPYKIINESELPQDLRFYDAWEVDETQLTDGVGSESNEFPAKEQV